MRYLYGHYGAKPWLLIDEYDSPIQSGYIGGYYDQMIGFMRGLLGAALKNNFYLDRAVITGILRVSKESLFSGLNNLKVYSVFNQVYSEYFGFTESEVKQLLDQAGLVSYSAEIRAWYNGYQMGDQVIYNPWSIVNCVNEGGELKPYWVNTSDNVLVKKLLAQGDRTVKDQLELLIRQEPIQAVIDENMVFGDLDTNANALWSLLLFSGYLKASNLKQKRTKLEATLTIPNQEVLALYCDIIQDWFTLSLGETRYEAFLKSLTTGAVEEFTDRLQRYLLETASIFDVSGHDPEKFYHGFVLGLIISLQATHEVQSNRESGYGRYDVMLIPKDRSELGIVMEFKVVRDPAKDLKLAAQDALNQINARQYKTTLRQKGITKILQLGLAFCGKQVELLSERL
jgi:hypothetical protein